MSSTHGRLRTPLKRARGLGSAHSGTHHFWLQRVSAIALIPLTVWFMVTLVLKLLGADQPLVAYWLRDPFAALLMGAMMVALFMHARLGVQVIIEDYVHREGTKLALLTLLNLLSIGLGAASLTAIAKLHFFGI